MGTGLSTCDADEAGRAAAKGFEVVRYPVPAVTLRAVLEEMLPAAIDLLKVDVEGFELRVLLSNDWSRFRPKVIVAEATYPESPQRRDDGVEAYLVGQGYRRVYFDGLNDFYLERDFQPPAETFDRPLNVFDHYEPYVLQELRHERQNARTYTASLERELETLRHERENARTYTASVERELETLRRERENERTYTASLERELETLRREHENARTYTASLERELETLRREHENAGTYTASVERELRRATLASEASSLDVKHACEELQAMHERCRGLATQLEQTDERCRGMATQLEQTDERCRGLAAQLEQVASQLSEQLRQLHLSTSWRVTRPLRALKRPRRTLRILLGRHAG